MRPAHIGFSALALITLLAAAACGSSSYGGGTITDPGPNGVAVGNNVFTPGSLTVPVGTAVKWTWAAGAVTHNVTFDDGAHSASQSAGTFTRTFDAAGTYHYHCTIHGAAMSGTITVQ